MPGPVLGCGKEHQPACPPTPAATINGTDYFTDEQMRAHGQNNYDKGKADAILRKYKDSQGHEGAL